MSPPRRIRAIGCMTGTSCDGVDAALVEVDPIALRATLTDHASGPLTGADGQLGDRLRAAREQCPLTASALAALAREAAIEHIGVIRPLIDRHGTPDLISLHGQTIVHAPPTSWQLCDPWPVAAAFGTRVVFDLRSADLAEGGQGAPLVPLADWVMFRTRVPIAVLNLGGFANVTILPAEDRPIREIRGGDLCTCCQFLDALTQQVLGAAFDANGDVAARGSVHAALAKSLAAALAPDGSDSLGTDAERCAREGLARFLPAADAQRLSTEDIHATGVEGVALAMARRMQALTGRGDAAAPASCLVAGGGSRHLHLVGRLALALGMPVTATSAAGIPVECREAAAWAILGSLRDARPITLSAVTGRRSNGLIDGAEIRPSCAQSECDADLHAT